jgi:hypothetical protein
MVLDALSLAVDTANRNDCAAFVVLGDLFDHDRPSPQVEAAVQEILSLATSPLIVAGNHDLTSDRPGDNALAPLKPIARIVEEPTYFPELSFLALPYTHGKADEIIPAQVERHLPRRRAKGSAPLVGIHSGVRDDSTAKYLVDAPDSISVEVLSEMMRERKLGGVAAGNWHERKRWFSRPSVQQVGCLCPTGFDNPGFDAYGWMAIWDSETLQFESIRVPGPRFISLRGLDSARDFDLGEEDCSVFVEVHVQPDEVVEARRIIDAMRQLEKIVDGSVMVDGTSQRKAASQAAQLARSSASLEGALKTFIGKMELSEGVKKERVLERVKGYLK